VIKNHYIKYLCVLNKGKRRMSVCSFARDLRA